MALAALVAGCPPPEYDAAELQIDLQVDPADDPFDDLGSVRVCLARGEERTFELYPRDPGAYLFRGVAEGDVLAMEVIGFDLPPDEIRAGEAPTVLAWATILGATVGSEAEPGYVEAPLLRCDDPCPGDCAVGQEWSGGAAAVALRRAAAAP